MPGAVVAPSDEQAAKLTEQHEGATWFGVSRVYLLTPTRAGTLTIPPIALTLHPGQASGPLEATTPALTLTIAAPARPPGAEHALSATTLTLTQHLDRTLDGLHVGDSVERTVTIAADGVRGMFLPPVAFDPIAGLGVYPADPRVDDMTDERQAFSGGRRIDAATYVVQTAGRYMLPAVTVTWWNATADKLASATLPAITFDAAATPAAPELALPDDADVGAFVQAWRAWRRPMLAAAGLLGLMGIAWILAPVLAAGRRRVAAARAERARRWEASEACAFERVTERIRTGDPAATYAALLQWLSRLSSEAHPLTFATLGARSADPDLVRELSALDAAVYGTASPSWSAGDLSRRLTDARRRLATPPRGTVTSDALPPLNP